ncbi:putative spermidine/putrescine transport system ATP-binding protein [Paraburkholderia atlantica]|uniref:Spermidine/putrescine import ATP-binding protein PotA n=1 Tax=Paraburkholderia atlantica TaxID=2654982 RepID=A0A7W8V5K6_PARAM|nr:ABC transporter ATP-binding protein [Paraburkholderia atlantica]MBB5423713.1 putative spermidine/putrescine transport system ATP-binding protein [Paraburkholderia atlantica]
MSSQPFISFDGVSKSYDGVHSVVEGLDLDVRHGEFVSLLGPSGSGKTTTLMMLAGFESPTRGEIRLAGKRLDDKPPHRRDIGMVFQNYALFPHMTIAENVAFPLSVRKVSRTEQKARVTRVLDMVELSHLAGRRPSQLSGGQQQRVALARALVFEPSVVLMDEPLGALDKRLRETMQYEIMRLHRELSLTIVYVTHDQNEALTMSDRVAVFSDGRIQQAATPTELYENAANAFVANFVGENNGLTGRVNSDGGEWAAMQLADGSTVRGRPGAGLASGDAAMLALRPERAHIAATPEAVQEATRQNMNVVHALVEELVYCGDHHRVHLKLGHGESMVVKVPNTQHHDLPALGRQTAVTWRCDDCKVLPAMAAAPKSSAASGGADYSAVAVPSSASPLIAGAN